MENLVFQLQLWKIRPLITPDLTGPILRGWCKWCSKRTCHNNKPRETMLATDCQLEWKYQQRKRESENKMQKTEPFRRWQEGYKNTDSRLITWCLNELHWQKCIQLHVFIPMHLTAITGKLESDLSHFRSQSLSGDDERRNIHSSCWWQASCSCLTASE